LLLPPLKRLQLLPQALLHFLGLLPQAPLHFLGLLPEALLHRLSLLLGLLYSSLRIPRVLPEVNAPLLHSQHLLHVAEAPLRFIGSSVACLGGSDDDAAHAAGPGSAACCNRGMVHHQGRAKREPRCYRAASTDGKQKPVTKLTHNDPRHNPEATITSLLQYWQVVEARGPHAARCGKSPSAACTD
jgi:hypothetical protein